MTIVDLTWRRASSSTDLSIRRTRITSLVTAVVRDVWGAKNVEDSVSVEKNRDKVTATVVVSLYIADFVVLGFLDLLCCTTVKGRP